MYLSGCYAGRMTDIPRTPSKLWPHCSRRSSWWVLAAVCAFPLVGCQRASSWSAIPTGAKVLALGDSITFGTGAAPGEDWPRLLADRTGWDIVNAGVPGDTAQNARSRIGSLLSEHQPALVIIELGGNDFLRRSAPALVKEDLRDLVRQAKAQGAQVVLVGVPAPNLLAAVASRLADAPLYPELAREEGVALVADVLSEVLSDPALRADPIHPNARGYQQLAEGLYQRLKALGFVAP